MSAQYVMEAENINNRAKQKRISRRLDTSLETQAKHMEVIAESVMDRDIPPRNVRFVMEQV